MEASSARRLEERVQGAAAARRYREASAAGISWEHRAKLSSQAGSRSAVAAAQRRPDKGGGGGEREEIHYIGLKHLQGLKPGFAQPCDLRVRKRSSCFRAGWQRVSWLQRASWAPARARLDVLSSRYG